MMSVTKRVKYEGREEGEKKSIPVGKRAENEGGEKAGT